ncbi:hypothetical protein BDY24DRAFT_237337 [Mrakia frigida]|uniref:uncharacterized protein n=1 Tax=Mrakia frigida TaxID=29902 RepID=UPI003FCC0BF4
MLGVERATKTKRRELIPFRSRLHHPPFLPPSPSPPRWSPYQDVFYRSSLPSTSSEINSFTLPRTTLPCLLEPANSFLDETSIDSFLRAHPSALLPFPSALHLPARHQLPFPLGQLIRLDSRASMGSAWSVAFRSRGRRRREERGHQLRRGGEGTKESPGVLCESAASCSLLFGLKRAALDFGECTEACALSWEERRGGQGRKAAVSLCVRGPLTVELLLM